MSGHSKWATTKRKKEATDQKRGKLFSKLSKVISVASRKGTDPSTNPALRMAIDNAKAASMPKENIERAIVKGSSGGEGVNYEEVIYEAYGPGRSGILIECLTDNKSRALMEVKTVLNKNGGSVVSAGSVSYQFKKRGQIVINIENNDKSGEEIEEAIIESGAEDFEETEGDFIVITDWRELRRAQKSISETGIIIDSAELVYNASNPVDLDGEKRSQAERLIEALEDIDDVNGVYTDIKN